MYLLNIYLLYKMIIANNNYKSMKRLDSMFWISIVGTLRIIETFKHNMYTISIILYHILYASLLIYSCYIVCVFKLYMVIST